MASIDSLWAMQRTDKTSSYRQRMNEEKIIQTQIEPLLGYFQNLIPLNKEEKQLVFDLFKPRLYRKRQYVLQSGDVCNQFNFIVRGCVRMYKVDDKGNTHIIQFLRTSDRAKSCRSPWCASTTRVLRTRCSIRPWPLPAACPGCVRCSTTG